MMMMMLMMTCHAVSITNCDFPVRYVKLAEGNGFISIIDQQTSHTSLATKNPPLMTFSRYKPPFYFSLKIYPSREITLRHNRLRNDTSFIPSSCPLKTAEFLRRAITMLLGGSNAVEKTWMYLQKLKIKLARYYSSCILLTHTNSY